MEPMFHVEQSRATGPEYAGDGSNVPRGTLPGTGRLLTPLGSMFHVEHCPGAGLGEAPGQRLPCAARRSICPILGANRPEAAPRRGYGKCGEKDRDES